MANVITSRDGAVSTQNLPRSTALRGGHAATTPKKTPSPSLSDKFYREEFIGAIEDAFLHAEAYITTIPLEPPVYVIVFPTPKTSPRAKPFDHSLWEGEV